MKSTFFNFFSTKVFDFVSNLNDDCSQLSFEVYNVFVAQKLRISEFLIELFFRLDLATSATSRGRNFNLSNLNRVSNFRKICRLSYEILLVGLEGTWRGVRVRFPKWVDSTPPPPPATKKPVSFRVKLMKAASRKKISFLLEWKMS